MSTLTLTVGGQTCLMNHVLTVPSFSGSGETPVQLSQVLLVTLPSQVCPQAGRISARAPTLGGVLVQLSQFGQHCHRVMERLLSPPTLPDRSHVSSSLTVSCLQLYTSSCCCVLSLHNSLLGSFTESSKPTLRCCCEPSHAQQSSSQATPTWRSHTKA